MLPPLATTEEVAGFGITATTTSLNRASARVRAHTRRPSLGMAGTTVSEELVELVGTIAARLDSLSPALSSGVQQESAGSEQVTFGFDSHRGVTGLLTEEKAILDRLFPRLPRLIVMGS